MMYVRRPARHSTRGRMWSDELSPDLGAESSRLGYSIPIRHVVERAAQEQAGPARSRARGGDGVPKRHDGEARPAGMTHAPTRERPIQWMSLLPIVPDRGGTSRADLTLKEYPMSAGFECH